MKKFTAFISVITLLLISCNKEDVKQPISSVPEEIVLTVDGTGIEADVLTRTTAVSSVPGSLYFAGTTGSGTSQSNKWSSTSKSVSSGKISTGYYQTASATTYNYYLSNLPMTYGSSGYTISADGTSIDAIAGTTSSYSTSPSVSMSHIFGRTGSVSGSCSGYSISNLSVTIKSNSGAGYKGTYNIYTGTWSSVTALSSTTLTSSSDLYLVPGSYTISASATRTKGDYVGTVSGSTSVTLTAGKIHDIAIVFTGDPAQPINISVSLASWSTTTVTGTIAG